MCSSLARRVRWWYQADRAWWRRPQVSQWRPLAGGGGHEAVVEGQLAGGQVTADEQVVPGRGGAEPGPGVPALALGAGPGWADLPAAPAPASAAAACLHVSLPRAAVR